MSEDNVTPIENKKQPKDPKLAAIDKMKETTTKEWNAKIEVQVKKTIDAKKIFQNEYNTLVEMQAESEEAKSDFAELIKGL